MFRSQFQPARRDAERPDRSGDDRRPGRPSLRRRSLSHGLPDAVDRAERALWRADADAVDGDDRAVPREHARPRPPAGEQGARPAVTIANPPFTGSEAAQWWRDLAASALTIRQVFFTSPNVRDLRARPVRASRSTTPNRDARARPPLHRDRHSRRPGRARAPVQSAPGTGGREGLEPREVARDREARGARSAAGDRRAAGAFDLVMGLGHVLDGGDRQGQERGRLRLPLGARPEYLQRPGRRRTGFDASLTIGQLDLPADVVCTLPAGEIPLERRDPARPRDRRQGRRRKRRAGAADPRTAGGHPRRSCGPRRRARLRRRSLRRQRRALPRRVAADPADPGRSPRVAARRAAARRRSRSLFRPARARPRSGSSTPLTGICRRASSSRLGPSPGSAAARAGSRSRRSPLPASSRLPAGERAYDPRPDRGHAARGHGRPRRRAARRGAVRDRVVAESVRARPRVRELARVGPEARARRCDLRRRRPARARRAHPRRPAAARTFSD